MYGHNDHVIILFCIQVLKYTSVAKIKKKILIRKMTIHNLKLI